MKDPEKMNDNELLKAIREYDNQIFGEYWCFSRQDLIVYTELIVEFTRREDR